MDALLASLTSEQISEWRAYDALVAEDLTKAELAQKAENRLAERKARR